MQRGGDYYDENNNNNNNNNNNTVTIKTRTYRTVIFPVVLYGCEVWSLTLREEHRLRVFENRALRKKLGLRKTR